jgi:plastocyanin
MALAHKTIRKLAAYAGCVAGTIVCGLALQPIAQSQALDVSIRTAIARQQNHSHSLQNSSAEVVVWLTPERRIGPLPAISPTQQYTLTQKDKQFIPHLLVVPAGSSVAFPNLDPFYHNVFSLFNGKRFDLGLYEAHTLRSVRFDREGVSYIFCNIHPEMGAVIIALSTPYYGVSTRDGTIVLHNIPPGNYRLNVWAENVSVERLNALSRLVEIFPGNTNLGTLSLETSGEVMTHHLNKFGENYNPVSKDPY